MSGQSSMPMRPFERILGLIDLIVDDVQPVLQRPTWCCGRWSWPGARPRSGRSSRSISSSNASNGRVASKYACGRSAGAEGTATASAVATASTHGDSRSAIARFEPGLIGRRSLGRSGGNRHPWPFRNRTTWSRRWRTSRWNRPGGPRSHVAWYRGGAGSRRWRRRGRRSRPVRWTGRRSGTTRHRCLRSVLLHGNQCSRARPALWRYESQIADLGAERPQGQLGHLERLQAERDADNGDAVHQPAAT